MSTLLYLLVIALALPFRTEQCEESSSSSSSSRSSSTSRMGETRTDTITPLGETTSPAVPTETPTEVESTLSPFCTSVFDNIGPFCQLVVEDDGECRLEVSDSTCDSCRNITATCGLFNGDICLSNLVSSCPAGPQSDAFLEEFCTVVLRNCTGLLNLGGLVLAAPADGVSGDGMHPETEQPPTTLPVSIKLFVKMMNLAT